MNVVSTLAMPPFEEELKADEGIRRWPYKDSLGRWACGVGCDLAAHGMCGPDGMPTAEAMTIWSDERISYQLSQDIAECKRRVAKHLPWSDKIDPVRRRVLWNMMFQMGWGDGKRGLSTFVNTLGAIERGDYGAAAHGILASKYHKQTPERAERMAYRMRTGNYY